jgi:thiamine kinase-like enzyme
LLSIDRANEEYNARAASTTGTAPQVFERVADPPCLVVGFVPGETLGAATIAQGDRLTRIASALRLLHGGPGFANRFNMFEIQSHYLRIVADRGLDLPPRYEFHRATLDRIRSALDVGAEATLTCHNDLLAENLLDDGDHIWIIDFEYSGNNEPSFELGNLAAESRLDPDQLAELCDAYWGSHVPQKVARAQLWGLVAQYGWTLWAVISADINPLNFDFGAWGLEKYDAFERSVASSDFEALLSQAVPPG